MAERNRTAPVGERVATLETEMDSLMGNGQPGRISNIEAKLDRIMLMIIAICVILLGSQHASEIIKWLFAR